MAHREHRAPVVVLNGDFHFFDADAAWFRAVHERIAGAPNLLATRGNVETEVARQAAAALSINRGGGSVTGGDASRGCGCGYPSYVAAGTAERADAIVARLAAVTADLDTATTGVATVAAAVSGGAVAAPEDAADDSVVRWLGDLPMFRTFSVGGLRVAVIHGDPDSLAGWALAVENVPPYDSAARAVACGCGGCGSGGSIGGGVGCGEGRSDDSESPEGPEASVWQTSHEEMASFFAEAGVDAFCSTHTCLPFGQLFPGLGRGGNGSSRAGATRNGSSSCGSMSGGGSSVGGGGSSAGIVFNNGSAGMPNFHDGAGTGLLTRVSRRPERPPDSLYGAVVGGVRFDAMPVRYDDVAFRQRFAAVWPAGTAAEVSYGRRIAGGVAGFRVAQAVRAGVSVGDAGADICADGASGESKRCSGGGACGDVFGRDHFGRSRVCH